jgi:hypothetical protein
MKRTNMVDAAGTTKYTYPAGNQLLTRLRKRYGAASRRRDGGSPNGPFASDILTNTYTHRLRAWECILGESQQSAIEGVRVWGSCRA